MTNNNFIKLTGYNSGESVVVNVNFIQVVVIKGGSENAEATDVRMSDGSSVYVAEKPEGIFRLIEEKK